jgi:hypothetical protein
VLQEAKAARAARLAAAAATTPFRPPSLGKKSSGLGTYDGHLGPKFPHMQDYDTDRIIKKKGMFPVNTQCTVHTFPPTCSHHLIALLVVPSACLARNMGEEQVRGQCG